MRIFTLFFCVVFGFSFCQVLPIPYIESQETGYFKVLQLEKSKKKFSLVIVIEYTAITNANKTFTFIETAKGSKGEIVVIDAESGKEYKSLNSVEKIHVVNINDYLVLTLNFEPLPPSTMKINLLKKGQISDRRLPSFFQIEGISLVDYTKNSNSDNYSLLLKKFAKEKFSNQTKKMMDSVVNLSHVKVHPNGFFYEVLKNGNGYRVNPENLKATTFIKTLWNVRLVFEQNIYSKRKIPDEIVSLAPLGSRIFTGMRKSWHYTIDEVKYLMDEGAKWRIIFPTLTFDAKKNRFGGYNTAYRFIEIETEKLYR